jgi:Na+/proline symporter
VLLFLASAVVSWQLDTIAGAWQLLIAVGAGTGLVLILRWYWWRINAWSEISAMVASFVVSLVAMRVVPPMFAKPADPRIAEDPRVASTVLLVTVAVSTAVWLATTFLTRPETDAVLDDFYRRVRPGGPGWATVSRRLGYGREPIPTGRSPGPTGWPAWSRSTRRCSASARSSSASSGRGS